MRDKTKMEMIGSQPRKQRKYAFNIPLHLRGKALHGHLSKELRTKYHARSIRLRKGDKIVVARGSFRKKTGTVDEIDTKGRIVYVSGIEVAKKDGSKTRVPLHPSKLIITELNTADKRRAEKLRELAERKR